MSKTRLFTWAFLILAATASMAIAGSPGDAGYTFLKIGTDARAEGMASAQTGLGDGLGAVAYNPAALAKTPPRQFLATYNNWLVDIQSGYLAGAIGVGQNGRLGLSVQYLDYGDFIARDGEGNPRSDFGASDLAIGVSLAGALGARTQWGVTGRFITESMDDSSSLGLAADVGLLHQLGDNRTRLGLAVRNAGVQTRALTDGGPKDDLPITFAAGISHRLQGAPLLAAIDLLKPRDDDFGAAAGLELSALSPLYLRAGYNTLVGKIDTGSGRDKWAGMTMGLGFVIDRVVIDYAYGSYSLLGDSHRFTLRTSL
ncbi:MAG: PorV/PorQ family protein [Candidatus Zixiibacteriota bacterium]